MGYLNSELSTLETQLKQSCPNFKLLCKLAFIEECKETQNNVEQTVDLQILMVEECEKIVKTLKDAISSINLKRSKIKSEQDISVLKETSLFKSLLYFTSFESHNFICNLTTENQNDWQKTLSETLENDHLLGTETKKEKELKTQKNNEACSRLTTQLFKTNPFSHETTAVPKLDLSKDIKTKHSRTFFELYKKHEITEEIAQAYIATALEEIILRYGNGLSLYNMSFDGIEVTTKNELSNQHNEFLKLAIVKPNKNFITTGLWQNYNNNEGIVLYLNIINTSDGSLANSIKIMCYFAFTKEVSEPQKLINFGFPSTLWKNIHQDIIKDLQPYLLHEICPFISCFFSSSSFDELLNLVNQADNPDVTIINRLFILLPFCKEHIAQLSNDNQIAFWHTLIAKLTIVYSNFTDKIKNVESSLRKTLDTTTLKEQEQRYAIFKLLVENTSNDNPSTLHFSHQISKNLELYNENLQHKYCHEILEFISNKHIPDEFYKELSNLYREVDSSTEQTIKYLSNYLALADNKNQLTSAYQQIKKVCNAFFSFLRDIELDKTHETDIINNFFAQLAIPIKQKIEELEVQGSYSRSTFSPILHCIHALEGCIQPIQESASHSQFGLNNAGVTPDNDWYLGLKQYITDDIAQYDQSLFDPLIFWLEKPYTDAVTSPNHVRDITTRVFADFLNNNMITQSHLTKLTDSLDANHYNIAISAAFDSLKLKLRTTQYNKSDWQEGLLGLKNLSTNNEQQMLTGLSDLIDNSYQLTCWHLPLDIETQWLEWIENSLTRDKKNLHTIKQSFRKLLLKGNALIIGSHNNDQIVIWNQFLQTYSLEWENESRHNN